MASKAEQVESKRAILGAICTVHDELRGAQQAARGTKTVLARATQAVKDARAALNAADSKAAKVVATWALRQAEAKEAATRQEVGTGKAQEERVKQAERRISALGQLPGELAKARGETGEEKKYFDVPDTGPKTTGKFFKIPVSDTQAPGGTFFKTPAKSTRITD